jgi:hypothetical protein
MLAGTDERRQRGIRQNMASLPLISLNEQSNAGRLCVDSLPGYPLRL